MFVARPPDSTASATVGHHPHLGQKRGTVCRIPALGQPWAWSAVLILLLVDFLWSLSIGLSIGGWTRPFSGAAALAALAALYRRRCRALADMSETAALWVVFTAAACTFTYLGATMNFPLRDSALARFDTEMGFDWLAWRSIVLAWPALHAALEAAYESLLLQLLLAILIFPSRNMTYRATELLLSAALAIIATTFISALWPVLGPCALSGGECAPYLPDLVALRTSGPWQFDLLTMQGIVQMPSYHVVLGVLLVYAFRNMGLIGWGVAGLNGFMLLAIPPIGGHYIADMMAGGVLSILCILIVRMAPRFRQS